MEMVSLNCSECVKREEESGIKFANFIKMMIYANGQGCGFFYSKPGSSFYRLQDQGTD